MAAAAAASVTSMEPFSFHPPPPEEDNGFEFRLPAAAMLSAADELFSDGKLVPLLPPPLTSPPLPYPSPAPTTSDPTSDAAAASSPRAPRCTSRWRELLGFKKSNPDPTSPAASGDAAAAAKNLAARSLKRLLHRKSRSDSHPLLRDQDPDLSRVSSSSDSDSDKLLPVRTPAPVRLIRTRTEPARGWSPVESPRMNASGKVVFRGLERSSSSPASGGGAGFRPRPRGMERSYSANVRVDPVISVFGFGQLFSASPVKEKKDKEKESNVAGWVAPAAGVAAGRRNKPEKLAVVLRNPHH